LAPWGLLGHDTKPPDLHELLLPSLHRPRLLAGTPPVRAGLLDDLAKPQEASAAASIHLPAGSDGKYDPKRRPRAMRRRQATATTAPSPGRTWVLMDERGPGVITHIWITFLGPEPSLGPNRARPPPRNAPPHVLGRRPPPAVEAPLGDFFANGFGIRSEVISLPWSWITAIRTIAFGGCPFANPPASKSSTKRQADQPALLQPRLAATQAAPASTPYFHAQYRQNTPPNTARTMSSSTPRQGHYVGTVLNVRTRSPSWFGEGTRRSTSTGRKPPPSGAPGLRTISCPPGASRRRAPRTRASLLRPMGRRPAAGPARTVGI